jgi:hypothetical protein
MYDPDEEKAQHENLDAYTAVEAVLYEDCH